jgi:hypothetical protein
LTLTNALVVADRLGLGLADEQIKDIIHRFDADGDGEIDYEEFAAQLAARPLPEDDDDAGAISRCLCALLVDSFLTPFD